MAVKLRLRRMGKKKQPIYKVIAADSRAPRDGKFLEIIGLYNPLTDPAIVDIKEDRALYWLGVGAQPTDTVKNLLSKQGILLKRDLQKQGLDEGKVSIALETWKKQNETKVTTAKKRGKSAEKADQAQSSDVEAKEQ